jgi:spore coat protein U-like protein
MVIFITLFCSNLSVVFAAGCNITCSSDYSSSTTIDLGNFDPYNYTNVTIPVTLSISCSGHPPGKCKSSTGLQYTYDLNGGNANNVSARRMDLSNVYLTYKICTSASCSNQYGNSSNGSTQINNSINFIPKNGNTDTYILYFFVPVQSVASPGTYSDSVLGTLTYQY